MTPEKWDVYLSICRKIETNGRGDDVSRDPRDLAMQQSFIDTFQQFLPSGRVLAPGAITEAVMLYESGYNVDALVLGKDNLRWFAEHPPQGCPSLAIDDNAKDLHFLLASPEQCRLNVYVQDAHDLSHYEEGYFDGYFTVQVHEHWISPYVHIGEVRYCMRDGGIVFVDAAGTTNPDMRQIWHTNLVPEQQVKEQWEYWGFKERWRGSSGDERPQFIFEKLPLGHPEFKNSGYIEHIMRARATL